MTDSQIDLVVRTAEKYDAKAILALYHQVNQETPYLMIEGIADQDEAGQAAIIESYLLHDQALMLVVEIEDQLVALANLAPIKQLDGLLSSEIGVCVKQAYWGCGIGTLLLEELMAYAKEVGTQLLQIEVVAENMRAISLYQKLGFKQIDALSTQVQAPDQTGATYLMTYSIS